MNKYILPLGVLMVAFPLSAQELGNHRAHQDSTQVRKLDEVVVVGYGSQRRSKTSSAVAVVELDKLSSRSLSGVGAALQGKAPGVTVIQEGGDPTASPRVNIRGLGGLNGEAPLYVVDGTLYGNSTPNINPNDIESISVLKDAAAAIYGARASGGVVLISTKKGRQGKITAEADIKFGVSAAWRLKKSLNAAEFQDVMKQAYSNVGKLNKLPQAFDPDHYPEGRITRTDWVDEIFRTGTVQEYNINVNGGSQNSKFFVGLNHRSLNGILLNTQSKRYNVRINSEFKINNWLRFGENMNYNFSDGNTANTHSGYTGAIVAAMYYPSNVPVYDNNGNFSGLPISVAGDYGDVINPVAYLHRLSYQNPRHEILLNPYLEISLLPGLKFQSNFSQNLVLNTSKDFAKRVLEVGKRFDFNRLTYSNVSHSSSLAEQTLSFNKSFDLHTLDAVAGYSFQRMINEGFSAKGEDFKNEADYLQYLTNANKNKEVDSYRNQQALESWFGRLNYDFAGRYLISLVGRRDATSLLQQSQRSQNYYSISAAWNLKRENFLKDINALSNLKFRGNYGIVGNLGSLEPSAVNPTLSRENNIIFGLDPQQNTGYFPTIYPNPNLTWGDAEQRNLGIDLGLWNNRLNFVADYYIKNSRKQILEQSLPSTAGYQRTFINAGTFQDRGIELGINFNSAPHQNLTYGFNLNMNISQNEVISLVNNQPLLLNNHVRQSLKPLRVIVGEPLYSYYGYQTAGIFKNKEEIQAHRDSAGNLIQPDAKPGDFRFLKKEGNVGKLSSDDMVNLGNPYPKFSYGFSMNLGWKNLDFNAFFQGVHGNKIFNGLKFITLNPSGTGQNYNMDRDILNAWTENNTHTHIPRLAAGDPSGNYSRVSDFYVEDGSYLRLKNMTIGYTLPSSLTHNLKMTRIRLYITADNLLTFTKYSGFDPEIGLDNGGIDTGRYPQARTFIFGTSFSF